MHIQLSQKERMLLEDDKQQEEVCVTKYKSYAQQASDPELKLLFNKISTEEQHHYNMVNQLLQGEQPTMSHGQTNSQQKDKSKHSSHDEMKGNAGDKVLCSDLLATEKYVSSIYDTGIFESVNPIVRQTLQHIQKEEQQHGEQLFSYMSTHGMYQVK